MANYVEAKKAIFGFGLGLLIFYLVHNHFLKKEKAEEAAKAPSEDDVQTAITAYQLALQNGETQYGLDQVNEGLKKEFGITITQRDDGKLVVNNSEGNPYRVI